MDVPQQTLTLTHSPAASTGMKGVMSRHPVAAFLAMVYAVSSLLFLPSFLSESGIGLLPFALPPQPSILLASIFGITLPAFLVTRATDGAAGTRALRRRYTNWRVAPHWYLLAVVAPPLAVVLGASVWLGGAPLNALADQWRLLFTALLPEVLLIALLINLWEEGGWTGFLLPRLQERWGPLVASVLVAACQGMVHLPLVFIRGGVSDDEIAPNRYWVYFAFLFVLTPPVRALMIWIWNGTGSLIVVALFHSAFNGTTGDALIPKLVPGHDTAWVYAVYAALALLLVVATRGRLGDRKSRATHSAPDPTDVVAMGRKEGRSMVRTIGLLIVGFVLAAGSLANTAAQGATPAPYPVAPDPAECVVARRSLEEVAAVVGTPAAGATAPVAASPTPFVRPSGEPADPATAADVTATVRQLFACTNAGDFLRVYALFTDDFLRAFLAGTPLTADVQAYFAATPVPLPTDQQRIIVRFGEAERLADGRVGLVVVLDEPDDPRTEEPDYVILVETGGRWLIEAVIEDGGLATTTP